MKFPSTRVILRATRGAAVFLPLLAGCAPGGGNSPLPSARSGTHGLLAPDAPLSLHAALAGGYASSVDDRGVPTFIWSTAAQMPPAGASHDAAARFHAARFATALALGPEALQIVEPALISDRGGEGIVVHLRQRLGGVPIYRRELRLLMRADHSLIALSGGLHPTTGLVKDAAFRLPPEAALAGAISHLSGANVPSSSVIDLHRSEGDDSYYQLADGSGVVLPEGAMMQKVLFPEGDRLRPAFRIELYAGRPDEKDAAAWRYVVAANDGAILERISLTQSDAFNYRVWADTRDNRPLDGPHEDWTPHPTGQADWSYPPFIAPPLISMEGFNTNPKGQPDPWLPAAAKDTNGNNANAYLDSHPPDGLSSGDYRATLTGPRSFDRVYNLVDVPTANQSQVMAGIVQAFYDTNWLHDYWYDSGFNEQAGNAQSDNYGRGGRGGDPIKLETQDFSGRDNSNMSTPGDGLSPRMQLFVWSGRDTLRLHVTPPDANQPTNPASFGPDHFDITGTLSNVDDGTFPSITDACEPIINDISGKIAIVDRGSCSFKRKSINAGNAGAIGMLVVNNVNGDAPRMGNGEPMATVVTIPVLATTKQAGAKIRLSMMDGPVTASFSRARDIDREGALDNTVLFHEWGHYLHHRLADCNAAKQCAAMSEGWADFNGLHTIMREGDNLDGTYALGIYASIQFDDPAYFGIRRQPYSINMRKNDLTLGSIADKAVLATHVLRNGGGPNSEVHNAGEVWGTMLFEVYVALQKAAPLRSPAITFDQMRRRMANYIVVAHQMEPADATFTESRDAMIAAAGASSPEDQKVIAEAFARRKAGTCANSPPRTSETFDEVIEGGGTEARLVIGDVTLDDSIKDCDGDGVLDAGEHGKITINIANGSQFTLSGAKVILSTPSPGITFIGPTTFDVPDLAPFASGTLTTEVTLDPKSSNPENFVLRVEPSQKLVCENATREVTFRINYDIGKQSSAGDDVEADIPAAEQVWKLDGDNAGDIWSRIVSGAPNHVWHGADLDTTTDTALESPDLVVSKDTFFQFRFEHRHSFEAVDQAGIRIYHDGAVVEISDDGGATWNDISKFANPGYDNTLSDKSGNPLANHKAYVDKNPAWPKYDLVTMNFLDAFAGKTVRVRFRIVTDSAAGESGWDLDNIAFKGLDNKPFTGIIQDAGKCGDGPRGQTNGGNLVGGGCALSPKRPPTFLTLLGLCLALAPLALLLLRRRRAH